MFAVHTLCAFIILINLACLPTGTQAVPSVALQSTTQSETNASTVVTEVTVTSGTLTDTTNPNDDQLREKLEVNLTTTTVPSTTVSAYQTYDQSIKCKSRSEIYSNCSNSCPASCEDPTRKPCRNFCWNGCECAPGYVKNHRWQCIPVDDCPKCALNEHYRNCGSNCEPTCETYQNVPVQCSNRASCKRGCFCDYGFVRDMDKNGTCVPIAECPQKCDSNEYWDVNGEPCIRTQDQPRPKCLFEVATPACVCNTGYKQVGTKICPSPKLEIAFVSYPKNGNQHLLFPTIANNNRDLGPHLLDSTVHRMPQRNAATKQCEPISPIAEKLEAKCSVNETYSHCDSECARNCFDDNKRQMCATICHRGCFCREGYRRDGSGRCVRQEECSSLGGYGTAVFAV